MVEEEQLVVRLAPRNDINKRKGLTLYTKRRSR
jgi:hypothetical protein